MSFQNDDQDSRVVAVVLISAVLLAVGLAVGMGISKVRREAGAASGGSSMVAAPVGEAHVESNAPAGEGHGEAAPAANEAETDDDASVVIENGVVTFYFASGKSDLAPGAMAALGDAIAAAKSGKHLVLSGFHDATGNPAKNAELAKQRALSVRSALVKAGVAESAVELKKPEMAVGSGNDAEARRVEVTIVE